MSTYLYCLLTPPKADAMPAGLAGIADAPVRSLLSRDIGPIEAWVATIDAAALSVRGRALVTQALLHNEVVDAALGTGRTPVPARYGSRYENDEACMDDLARRADEFRAVLERVVDAVEMSVLVVPARSQLSPPAKPKATEASAGRRYLESLRAHARETERARHAAEHEADRITGAVRALVREETRRFAQSGVMSIAHLLSREQLGRYKEAVATVSLGDSFRLVVGEARAPYSFTSSQPTAAGHDSGKPNGNE
jgi:hypothetical protein